MDVQDIVKQIIGFCSISSLFCLQFVNKNFRNLTKKNLKIIKKMKVSDRLADNNNAWMILNNIAQFGVDDFEIMYYTQKIVEIVNDLTPFGTECLNWLYSMFPHWPLPDYCYAMNVETLEWIWLRDKEHRTPKIIFNYSPPYEVLEWMIYKHEPLILGFDINQLAINKHYDLLTKIKVWEYDYYMYNQYELLCWMIDENIPVQDSGGVLVFLTGGGKRFIRSKRSSFSSSIDVSYFKCNNIGAARFKQAFENGYTRKRVCGSQHVKGEINMDVYIGAVEANNVELLDYLHSKIIYTHVLICFEFCDPNGLFVVALEANHYEATKWILEHYDINRRIQLLCSDLKILLFLRDNGFIWDASVYINAVRDHDFDLIKIFYKNKVPWEHNTNLIVKDIYRDWMEEPISDYIIRSGNIEILQWAISNGCPLSPKCNKHSSTIPMMKYLTSLGYPPTSGTLRGLKNNLDGVKWLCRTGIQFKYYDMHDCSYYGSNDVNYWLLKHRKELIIKDPHF